MRVPGAEAKVLTKDREGSCGTQWCNSCPSWKRVTRRRWVISEKQVHYMRNLSLYVWNI